MKKTIILLSKSISPLYKSSTQVFVFLLILETIVFATQYFYNGLGGYFMPSLSAFIALCLIAPWIAKYLYKTFLSLKRVVDDLTESNYQDWFLQQEHLIFGINRWSVLIVIVLAISGGATDYLIWGTWHSLPLTITYSLHLGFLFGILGNLGWSYWGILLFAYRLRVLKFDLEPFETKKEEFDKLNSAFLGMLGCGIILYIGSIIAGWLALGSFILTVPIMKFWIFPLAFMVIGFFVGIQYFLHKLMLKAKKIRINKITILINSNYQEWEKSKSSIAASAINDLLSWKEKIEKEPDSPFDFLTIMSVIITVLLPTFNAVKELF